MQELCSYQVTTHPLRLFKQPQLDVRIFYLTISNCEVGESTPDRLTVNHLPLGVGAVNGKQSSFLRMDRADTRTEEATFISTDHVRITSSASFEVFNRGEMLIAGVMEWGKHSERWEMKCRSVVPAVREGILKASNCCFSLAPVIEVFVAGCCGGRPVVMTETFSLTMKENKTSPEYEEVGLEKRVLENDIQLTNYQHYKVREAEDMGLTKIYSRQKFRTWFNAGVGIGLGVSLSVGVAVGTLVQTYTATT